MNQETITVTTKGTFTLPAHIRKDMGVNVKGDRLAIHFDKAKSQVIIKKTTSFEDIQKLTEPYIKGKKPLLNPSEFYHQNRANGV